ncbi:hypothetical protein OKHIF_41860 [Mycobacteroides chelonae]
MHGHSRAGTENPGLIARAGHHAPTSRAADKDRSLTQGWPGQLLDRGEEGIHVEVQNPSTGSTHAIIVLRRSDVPCPAIPPH